MLRQTPIEVRALASPALLERGCVNIISLEAMMEEAGVRWPRISDGLYSRIETLFRQRLGSTDFFARLDDASYVVTMPSAESEDVNTVCLRIAYDLHTSFFGSCDIDQIRVSKASNGGSNQLSLDQLPREHIAVLAEKAGIQGFAQAVSIVSRNSKTDASDPAIKSLEIVHQYVPVWAAVNSAITTYICETKQIVTSDIPKKVVPITQLTPKDRIKVELSCLYHGVNHLSDLIETGKRFILGIAVSFDVLGMPAGRMDYLNACRSLSQEFRQYLDFILTDVPQGVAQTRLYDLTNTLRPFARSVSATVAPGTHNFAPYQGIGLRAIGYNRREFNHEHQLRSDDITNLVQAAKKMKLSTFMLGIQKLTNLHMAHEANIQLLSGPAIAPASASPQGMTRLAWDDILSSHELLSA